MSIYFFYGDEDYNIELEINKLKKKLLDKNFSSMNFKKIDSPAFSDLISLLRNQPMMFGNMMIVISVENYFAKALEDSELEEISKALEDNIDSLCVVLTYTLPRDEGKKVDTRKKIYKIISKYSTCQEFPTFKTYKVDDIINWINKEAKKQEVELDKAASTTLIEQVGNNLRQLSKEIEKLKLLAYPKNKITKEMVKEICISNEDLFEMADYLMKNDKAKALLEFKKLLSKKHPLEILSALQTMLRKWIIIKSKSSKSPFELSKLVGQHEFVVKNTQVKLKNTSLKDLVTLKKNLIEAEYKIKSGKSNNHIDEVEIAFLK